MMSAMSDANCWYVVVNPVSGGGRARRYWPQLRMALDRKRVPYRSTESTAAGVASETVAGALRDGHRHFLALGGDGSFHQLINGLMSQQQLPLTGLLCGVAPVGSGNDWARALGIPADPAQLAAVMSDCRSRYVDLGFVTCTEPGGNGRLTVAFHNGVGARSGGYRPADHVPLPIWSGSHVRCAVLRHHDSRSAPGDSLSSVRALQ